MNQAHSPGPAVPSAERPRVPLWKRALDVITICALLPFTLPVMAVIALVIRCASRGPILFRQERVGLNGERFTCLKFRSMVAAADTRDHQKHLERLLRQGGALTKLDATGDTRLIRGGSFLRATGLDELPQLFNVLRGDMSLVGPRPCVPYEYDLYEEHHKQRLTVLPGLTGLWQVNGKNKTTFEEMIRMDLFYARNQSLFLDLQIILQTFPTLGAQMWEWVRKRLVRPQSEPQIPAATQKQMADSL